MSSLVFVYGSLLTGGFNYDRILAPAIARGGARLVGSARTGHGWRLYSQGPFPAMSRGAEGRVVGEVFEVDDLTMRLLDRLEGVEPRGGRGGLYWREPVAVFLDGRRPPVCAWVYLQAPERQAGRQRVASGSWRAWEADRAEREAWLRARTSGGAR